MVALFFLIMGIVEFGRAFSIYQSITNAAREGARFAVAPDPATGALPPVGDVETRVTSFLQAASLKAPVDCGAAGRDLKLPCVQVDSTSHDINAVTVTYTKVKVVAPYTFFMFPFGSVNITAYSEMRNETN
jgi:hypothetical protein